MRQGEIEDPYSGKAGINPRISGTGRLDLPALFGNRLPLVLEIGSGKGRFLLDSAANQPDRNFLGIEKSLHYYRVIAQRIERRGLQNARIINFDAFSVMRDMLPDASVHEIHIYFPDPWPRKREQKRRIIRADAAIEMRRILEDGCEGIYVTDHEGYFWSAVPVLEAVFSVEAGAVPPEQPSRTNYEAKYRQAGRSIYQARFRKTGR